MDICASDLQEIIELLKNPNLQASVINQVVAVLTQVTNLSILQEKSLRFLATRLSQISAIEGFEKLSSYPSLLAILVNLSALVSFDFFKELNLNHLLDNVFDKLCKDADLICKLFSNLTRCNGGAHWFYSCLKGRPDSLARLVQVFCHHNYNPHCDFHDLALVFCNLSQIALVRDALVGQEQVAGEGKGDCQSAPTAILKDIIPFTTHVSHTRRTGACGTIRNCCLESNNHEFLLNNIDILPSVLLPLTGPDEFTDDENSTLPLDLQYLPSSKEREDDSAIRSTLIAVLYELCSTRLGREYLRSHGTYLILRQLHLAEKDVNVKDKIEEVVALLIDDEPAE